LTKRRICKYRPFVLQYTSMSRKIAFDLTQIPVNKTGIGIYAVNLVRELLQTDLASEELDLYFFAQDDDPLWQQIIRDNPRCLLIGIDSRKYRKLYRRFIFEQFRFPRMCKRLGIDIIYSFHYTMPYFTPISRIVTIPDMTFYLFPKMHEKIKRIYFKRLIPFSLKRSAKIVTISESTKQDMLTHFKHLPAEKISVIHLGVTAGEPVTQTQESAHLNAFGLKEKHYCLYVGTLEPRKNITGIVEAFSRIRDAGKLPDEDYKLVIAGGKGWFYESIFDTVKTLGLDSRVVFTGYVTEEVKQVLLKYAGFFIYPSYYEGFGLPVLEAMVYGVPVITGNVSSLPEVAGDAALLIEPGSVDDIAGAMEKLLLQPQLRKELSEKSLKQVKNFTWNQTARNTLEILKTIPL